MSEQEKKCINEINNFIKEYKKTMEKDTDIYLLTSQYGVFDKTLYPYEHDYITFNDKKDKNKYKIFKNCPITDNTNIRNIITNINAKLEYKEDKIKNLYASSYNSRVGYIYSYYKMDLSPSFFDKILDKIKNIF